MSGFFYQYATFFIWPWIPTKSIRKNIICFIWYFSLLHRHLALAFNLMDLSTFYLTLNALPLITFLIWISLCNRKPYISALHPLTSSSIHNLFNPYWPFRIFCESWLHKCQLIREIDLFDGQNLTFRVILGNVH